MSQLHELKIEKLTYGGQGIGYLNGKVCFVDQAIPGETVRIAIKIQKKDYNVAVIKEIVHPSKYRVKPRCPIFGMCGGCHLMHIDPNSQLLFKKEIFLDTLRRTGRINRPVDKIISDDPWLYRNRVQIPVQYDRRLKIGYFKSGTHQVVDHKLCHVNHRKINECLPTIRHRIEQSRISIYNEKKHAGNMRHFIVKVGINTGQTYVSFVTRESRLPRQLYAGLTQDISGCVGISQNINTDRTNRVLGYRDIRLEGREYYEEKLDDLIFRLSPRSFFQVNTNIFSKILENISRSLIPDMNVIDLYSGMGVIAMYIASRSRQVIAVEENAVAVKDGIENARLNKITNVKFMQGKVEEKLGRIRRADVIILDPPRRGVSISSIKPLDHLNPKQIIYLSCNPATFSRDARHLIDRGYRMSRLMLFDMFPQTYHIESLAIFEW